MCHDTCDSECLKTVTETETRPVCTCSCCTDRTGFFCWTCNEDALLDKEPEKCKAFWHVARPISEAGYTAYHGQAAHGSFPYTSDTVPASP